MRRNPKSILNFQGQALIEVVISLAVVVLLAVSLVTTSLITQRSSRSARNSTQASKLAQQNVEQIRVFRDRQGFTALTDGSCFTLNTSDLNPQNWTLATSATSPCPELITLGNTIFSRSLSIATDPSNANKKLITVTVTWTEPGGTQTVTNKTFLANWCPGDIVAGPSPCL